MARHDHTKHLRVYIDSDLNFSKHVKEAALNASKGVSLLKCLSKYVDLAYKLHMRPHLDYGDIIYHNKEII